LDDARAATPAARRERDAQLEDELLAVIGHDLRSPLSVVTMTAAALSRSATDDSARATARRLRSAGDRMLRMIEELVDLGRLRRGEPLPLDPVPSDVGAICASIVAELAVASPGRLALEVEPGELTAEIDLVRFARAVESLLANALRLSRKKDVVTVRIGEDGDGVVVAVSTPATLEESAVERAFEPFTTTPEGRLRSDGAGLGMFIAREVARAHGGDADVSCGPEGPEADGPDPAGTTYSLRLPRRRA
jgi:signal transduction histidine kinase